MRTVRPDRPVRLGVDGRVLDDRYHGIGRTAEALLRQLAGRDGLEVTVFLREGQSSERFDVDGLLDACRFSRARFDESLTSPRQYARWPGALRAAGIDVAVFPYHLGAALSGPARRVSVVHDCILEADRTFAPDRRTRLLYTGLTHVVARRTSILVPSQASATELRRHYGVRVADRHVVPWGVDPSFSVSGVQRVASLQGQELGERYYLHVGARRPHKNVKALVSLLSLLRDDERLVLVGSADDRFHDPVPLAVRELGLEHRVVQLRGVSEDELRALYAGARAFLYPSLVEGFGLPLLEAMAAGLPVVASDIPVFREVAEGAALLVPPDRPAQWRDAVRRLDDPACHRQLVTAGLERARRATWAASAERFLLALEDMTGRPFTRVASRSPD